jgi:hypothetical protein
MPSKGAAMRFLIQGSIVELFKKGYLESNLDWDVKGKKFTIRVRNNKGETSVGLITYCEIPETIVLTDNLTGQKTSYKIDFDRLFDRIHEHETEIIDGFINAVCDFAQQLREESESKKTQKTKSKLQ